VKPRLIDRLRYAFDNSLSKGPAVLIAWLALISAILVLLASLLIWAAGVAPQVAFGDLLWTILREVLGRGVARGADTPWLYLLAMLLVSFGGLFVTGTLIGALTESVRHKITALRQGRSSIIDTDHTVILGWGSHIFSILSELALARASERSACIAILSERDKPAMEDDIRAHVSVPRNVRIVCRHGSTMESSDLAIANLNAARSIIIAAPDDAEPDVSVIKTILAITNNPARRPEPYSIVAEIHGPQNVSVARLGRSEVELVLAGDVVARIAAQTCRQPGLSVVYTELLDFEGDEMYFHSEPALTGKTFGDALLSYEDSMPIGLLPRGATPQLNPPQDTMIQDGDQIIAIAHDDTAIHLSEMRDLHINHAAIQSRRPPKAKPERTLILGWNWHTPLIINELDHYVAPGSIVTVVANCEDGKAEIKHHCRALKNETVNFQVGSTTDRRVLDELGIETYDHVIILCYCDTLDRQRADGHTLVTLLHLRDIAERSGHPFSIVSEMLDIRNRNLAEVARVDDFIVSEQIISLLMAQVSENRSLNAVFADLFDPQGSEIHLKPTFYTVVEAARRRGEIALGYRLQEQASDAAAAYGVVINPKKSALVTFCKKDRIIVLAER